MRVLKNRNLLVNQRAPHQASYHQGPVLTNGALEFVYNKPVEWPVQKLTGPGIVTASQFAVLPGAPQSAVVPAVTHLPIYGAGVPAGQIEYQNLVDDSELH